MVTDTEALVTGRKENSVDIIGIRGGGGGGKKKIAGIGIEHSSLRATRKGQNENPTAPHDSSTAALDVIKKGSGVGDRSFRR